MKQSILMTLLTAMLTGCACTQASTANVVMRTFRHDDGSIKCVKTYVNLNNGPRAAFHKGECEIEASESTFTIIDADKNWPDDGKGVTLHD